MLTPIRLKVTEAFEADGQTVPPDVYDGECVTNRTSVNDADGLVSDIYLLDLPNGLPHDVTQQVKAGKIIRVVI